MDILLIGGASSFMDTLIVKLSNNGHRVYLLTGQKDNHTSGKHVFEKFDFPYSGENAKDIIGSVNPDLVIHMGAFDTNYDWQKARDEAVRYESDLINLLMAFSLQSCGRFVYFSSQEIFENSHADNISEEEPVSVNTFKGMAIAQGEEICRSYRKNFGMDTIILRFDNLYFIPKKGGTADNPCFRQCYEAIKTGKISANERNRFSMIHQNDAVDYAYQIITKKKTGHSIYNITSAQEISEMGLAKIIQPVFGDSVEIVNTTVGEGHRTILGGRRFLAEFPAAISVPYEKGVCEYAQYMKKHKFFYISAQDTSLEKGKVIRNITKILGALLPYLESIIIFFLVYWLNGMASGTQPFDRIDFYLLYVIFFAILHGQQQAVFTAVLSTVGYFSGQAQDEAVFDILVDYNTYVWIAQLFIIGLAVGYMKDRLRSIRNENAENIAYLREQLEDIESISDSNARIKKVFESELINQQDSLGKVYAIVSGLDKRQPEEVPVYATEILSRLMDTKDAAIYKVANKDEARLISATSQTAQKLGVSIKYTAMGDMYDDLSKQHVFINKKMDSRYPVMAAGIYENNSIRMIFMLWSIPWERMNLAESNRLRIIALLLQNKIIQSERFLETMNEAHSEMGSNILSQKEFSKILKIYVDAERRNLINCVLFRIFVKNTPEERKKACEVFGTCLYDTDYIGIMDDGQFYILFANTDESREAFIAQKTISCGYSYYRKDTLEL